MALDIATATEMTDEEFLALEIAVRKLPECRWHLGMAVRSVGRAREARQAGHLDSAVRWLKEARRDLAFHEAGL